MEERRNRGPERRRERESNGPKSFQILTKVVKKTLLLPLLTLFALVGVWRVLMTRIETGSAWYWYL